MADLIDFLAKARELEKAVALNLEPHKPVIQSPTDLGPSVTDEKQGAVQSQPAQQEDTAQETLRASMRQAFQEFVNRTAEVYEELSQWARNAAFPKLQVLHDQVEQAYREANWTKFQAALMEAKELLSRVQVDQGSQQLAGKHWVYRAWSRVLDAEVWFVCCEQEVAQLTATDVARGCIYTEAELVELLQLPQPSPQMLTNLHQCKAYFDATVAPRVQEG